MDFLTQIIDYKKNLIVKQKHFRPESSLRDEAEQKPRDARPFIQAMETGKDDDVHIIAEIKRASPSKGLIHPDLMAGDYAAKYERGGASAISVLTEDHWFRGSITDLADARAATTLPVLRKDFIISPYQIYESAVIGADAVLLIVRILSEGQLRDFLDLCKALQLDALVEVHTPQDAAIICDIPARLIGINNRDLASFATDIRKAGEVAAALRQDQIPVAASGISSKEDIRRTLAAGIRHFLIGESIVRSANPEEYIQSLKE